mmetsp:Transcript_24609/g.68496  ORF Transcript_24609/g.68496 Transcript_24609/m.68496 type:complete len:223 (-) Transcript_24609:1481-2149(-)
MHARTSTRSGSAAVVLPSVTPDASPAAPPPPCCSAARRRATAGYSTAAGQPADTALRMAWKQALVWQCSPASWAKSCGVTACQVAAGAEERCSERTALLGSTWNSARPLMMDSSTPVCCSGEFQAHAQPPAMATKRRRATSAAHRRSTEASACTVLLWMGVVLVAAAAEAALSHHSAQLCHAEAMAGAMEAAVARQRLTGTFIGCPAGVERAAHTRRAWEGD